LFDAISPDAQWNRDRVVMAPQYNNTPTVVVVLVPLRGGLLMIRRALPGEGQGKLALPGGYQMLGQTWQEAGSQEVLEETGVVVAPGALQVVRVVTTPDRRQNLLFCQSPPVEHDGAFVHDAEVSEVLVIHEPVETAFALHAQMVREFFARSNVTNDLP
jgi:ADP-ribose pyrophosphatase YjhB (NUDIX family)